MRDIGKLAEEMGQLNELILSIRDEALSEAANIAEGHYEDHCCEDCACSYWRENVAKAILNLKSPQGKGGL